MGRIHTILYECDWCKDRMPPRAGGYDEEPPAGWLEIDHSWLCMPCLQARAEAIDETRFQRLNKDSPRRRSIEDAARVLVDQPSMPGAGVPSLYAARWKELWAVLNKSEDRK